MSYSEDSPFTHSDLNNAVKESPAFIAFKDEQNVKTVAHIKAHIKSLKDVIPFETKLLAFNQNSDFVNGLIITIDQISWVQIFLEKINYDKNCKNITSVNLKYELYDTYGLDDNDLKKFGLLSPMSAKAWVEFWDRTNTQKLLSTVAGSMFNAWWLLQYKHNCVPFVTKVVIYENEVPY